MFRIVPYSGKHYLEQHIFNGGGARGEHLCTKCSAGGISLEREDCVFIGRGSFTSEPVHFASLCNEMVLTWNGVSPMSTVMAVDFRVRGGSADWSGWLQMGDWKSEFPQQRRQSDLEYGELKVDHFKAVRGFDAVQYRVTFRSADPSQTPLLRRITLCVSDTKKKGEIEAAPFSGGAVNLPVPWMSQYDPETVKDRVMIESGVCAATSVTMVLRHYGMPATVRDVGRRAYDPSARIYGNWAFLAAAAAEFGPDSWVERFTDWQEVYAYLKSGVPVVISIAYPKGTFTAEPDKTTAGHLMIVRGFTDEGDVIVNDPGAVDEKRGRGFIYPGLELAKAFFGHGGVGIIIKR